MGNHCSLRFVIFSGLLAMASGVFAAIPIQDRSVQGAAAAEARLKLLSAAESCLGTPYRYAGLDRRGLDCSGLVFLSFREGLNIAVPRTAESLYTWTERIETSELAPGDLVFFVTTRGSSAVSHVGIYAGDNRFIHSASEGPRTGVMYSRLDEEYWRRTYKGAGRALPWDAAAARALAEAMPEKDRGSGEASFTGTPAFEGAAGISDFKKWGEQGFFTGFGAAWTWGGFFEGASLFRGVTILGTAGYRWSRYRASLELRPEWDIALGVFRLPLTLSLGTDFFQVFIGPAYTFGEPELDFEDQKRPYQGGGTWLGEAGIFGGFPVRVGKGAFSLYGELAWQPYRRQEGVDSEFKPDIIANFRFSTGFRYFWMVK